MSDLENCKLIRDGEVVSSKKNSHYLSRTGSDGTNGAAKNIESTHTPQDQQLTLSWVDINAWTREKNGPKQQRQLLKNVSGIAKPGQLLAIMGPSGAGKTTMLNVISGRLVNSPGATSEGKLAVKGSVFLNGRSVGYGVDILRRFAAFVEQDDVFPGLLTVEEHLWFHSQLRMINPNTTDQQRRHRITALMTELNLSKAAATLIGFPQLGMKTLSGGEQKRLSVATELIANPPLLLLDEPTSGLDAFTAESVILALKQLAMTGKTVAFTIHQPSSDLFKYFDRLLLMADGRVCYHGDANEAINFFAEPPLNLPCPLSYNPPDFYIDVLSKPFLIGENYDHAVHAEFISSAFVRSRYGNILTSELAEQLEAAERKTGTVEEFISNSAYSSLIQPQPSSWLQLRWSTWRSAKCFYRSPQWMRYRLIAVISFSILYGLLYFGLAESPRGVMNRNGLLSQLVSISCWDNLNAYAFTIPHDRPFLLRDHGAGLLSLSAYFFGRQFVELPLLFVFTCVQTGVIAAFSNLWSLTTVTGAFCMLLSTFLTALNAASLGYLGGFLSDNVGVQIALTRIIMTLMMVLNGYYLNISTVPTYLVWAVYASFFYWASESLFVAEWADTKSLNCPKEDSSDGRCFANGREVLDSFGFGGSSRLTIDFCVLAGMVIILRAASLFVLYYRFYGQSWIAMLKRRTKKQARISQVVGFSPQAILNRNDS